MKFQQLLEEVKHYVTAYFETHHDPELIYHNLKHTKDVVTAATQIANHYQLSDEDFFIVIAAAWFHDTGYFADKMHHEVKSVEVATHELKQLQVETTVIDKVNGCIMATQMPQKPTNLLEQILCDADLFHLGTDDFRDKSKLMRKELEACKHQEIDKDTWRKGNIEFLETHHYYTDYTRLLLNDQKAKNLERLKDKDSEVKEKTEEMNVVEVAKAGQVETVIVKDDHDHHDKKHKNDKPERGIETMFRISSSNHQRLSDMADNKAHIMITVNSIILSAIISLVLRKLDEHSALLIPTFMLLTVSLTTMIFSILSTRPSIPPGLFTHEDIEKRTVNLLFFGNFYRMSLTDYSDGMLKMMDDKDFLYGSLIRDNYSQGVVLGKKYRLLRISYNVFMFGLIISVLAFIISSLL